MSVVFEMKNKTKAYRATLVEEAPSVMKGVGSWLNQRRKEAFDLFKSLEFPTQHEEAWKYIDINPILGESFKPASSEQESIEEDSLQKFYLSGDAHRLAFVNGDLSDSFSDLKGLPEGVLVQNLKKSITQPPPALQKHLLSLDPKQQNIFSTINAFSFQDGLFVYVPDDTSVDLPIHTLFFEKRTQNYSTVSYPRILVVLGKRAKANLILDFISTSTHPSFVNGASEFYLGEGASLDLSVSQRLDGKVSGFGFAYFDLQKGSALNSVSFAHGGEVHRMENQLVFSGEGSSASFKGLSLLKDKSQAYYHTTAHHRVSSCESNQFYKNILAGSAKSEFNSMVRVSPQAMKTNSQQLNKNLLLSDEAEAHTRPQLKIDADDVFCAHGASVGQLEKDELFYLRSRGLSEEAAKFVLTYGFAEEIIEFIPVEALRTQLQAFVTQELHQILKNTKMGV